MGQYGFDRACFSVVFVFLLCFIAHLYEANWGTDMEVLACIRPGFLFCIICKKRFLIKAVDFLKTKNHDETEKNSTRRYLPVFSSHSRKETFSAMLKTTCEHSLVRDRTENKNVTAGV